jgi:hypothetical protein
MQISVKLDIFGGTRTRAVDETGINGRLCNFGIGVSTMRSRGLTKTQPTSGSTDI